MSQAIDWDFCQRRSDQILAEGWLFLQRAEALTADRSCSDRPGNYLISLEEKLYYVGEAKNLTTRIRTQFAPKTSTFFKSYLKKVGDGTPIGTFRMRHIDTAVGRKELEEFGIVNGPCPLNKFQLGKRTRVACASQTSLWSDVQSRHLSIIAGGQAALLSRQFVPWFDANPECHAGVYVVRAPEGNEILYIGESSDVEARHDCHSKATYFSALRRHVATELLSFSLKVRNGKAKYLTDAEDAGVSSFLRRCNIAWMSVSLGRFELEEHLIRKFHPKLNRKDREGDG